MPPLGYEKTVLSKLVPTWQQFISSVEQKVATKCVDDRSIVNLVQADANTSLENHAQDNLGKGAFEGNDENEKNNSNLLIEDIADITEISDQIDKCLNELKAEDFIDKEQTLQNEAPKTTNACVIVSEGMNTYRILFYLLIYVKNPTHVHETVEFDIKKRGFYDLVYLGLFSLNFDLSEKFLAEDFSSNDFFERQDLKAESSKNINDTCETIKLPRTFIAARSRLILVIGMDYSDYIEYMDCEISEIAFISEILSRNVHKPDFEFTIPRVGYISRHSIKEREYLYTRGGVYCASSEVFVMDILCNSLPADSVSGIVVMNAHKVCTDAKMSFLLNLYKRGNSFGFIKAISDDVAAFSDMNVVEQFHCEDMSIHLLPRSSSEISGLLNNKDLQPETHEISVPLPPQLEKIQTILVNILQDIIRHLKGDNTSKMIIAEMEFDLNTLVYERGKISTLEKRLGKSSAFSIWDKTKDDLNALTIFSQLLHLSQETDAITFLKKVDVNRLKFVNSPWMWDRKVLDFFQLSEERVFRLVESKPPRVECVLSQDTIFNAVKESTKSTDSTVIALGYHAANAVKCHLYEFSTEALFRGYAEWRAQGCLLAHGNLNPDLSSCGLASGTKVHALVTRIKWVDSLFQDYLNGADSDDATMDLDCLCSPTDSVKVAAVTKGRRDAYEATVKPAIPLQLSSRELENFECSGIDQANAREGYSVEGLASVFDKLKGGRIVIVQGNLSIFRQIELNCIHLFLKQCYRILKTSRANEFHSHGTRAKVLILIYKDSIHSNSFSYHLDSEVKKWQSAVSCLRTFYSKPRIPSEQLIQGQLAVKGGNAPARLVIVDKREFKCPLPYQLFLGGLEIIPTFLKTGDYVITMDTCIERKSPQDLANSLTVGRLFNQIREMKKAYENAILLIEFDDFSFHLTPFGRNRDQFSLTYCRLITLCLLHSNLQLLWSTGPRMTSRLINRLKENSSEPCTQQVRIELFESDYASILAEDFIGKIPGVSDWMARQIFKRLGNLKDLSAMTPEGMERDLGFNKSMADDVYKFFHTPFLQLAIHSTDIH